MAFGLSGVYGPERSLTSPTKVPTGRPRKRGNAPGERAQAGLSNPRSPLVDHQVELVDEGVDFFEILAATFFGFDIESATECDHVAEVTDGVL
jgi:hypothetical protein